MAKTLKYSKQTVDRYVVIGSKGGFHMPLPERVTVCKRSNLKVFVHGLQGRVLFISCASGSTYALFRARLGAQKVRRSDRLLTMETPRAGSVPALHRVFDQVIGVGGYRWLAVEELMTVITGKDAANRLISGAADSESRTLALMRGDFQTVIVPFSLFQETTNGVKPDFGALAFTDYGHTVVLGEYEASADAILYEIDEEYRRKLNKQRLNSEKSFGASLRRLRIQKRLKRSDFAPLAGKSIARIERNEIGKPHGRSLKIIAQRLGVPADQIETY